MDGLESNYPPRFGMDSSGKATTVTLDVETYMTLLVRASVTDQALWPPGARKGATALVRVRQIESDCVAQEGQFDWEKLPSEVQDEYDRLCLLLDSFRDLGGLITWEAHKRGRKERRV